MTQVLFHTDAIDRYTLQSLRKSGIIPVKVTDMGSAKLVIAIPPEVSGNAATEAAFEAISAHIKANGQNTVLANRFTTALLQKLKK